MAAVLACSGDGGPNPVREAMAVTPPGGRNQDAVVFRFPHADGRAARLYRLPSLSPVTWHFDAPKDGTASVVGFAADDDLVYVLSTTHELVALDLTTGREREVTDSVHLAALGPEGTVVVVRADSSVNRIQYRGIARWTTRFTGLPTAIWPAIRDRVIGLVPRDSGRTLELLADGQQPVTQRLPDGHLAVARWGDIVAVAADSGVVLLDPADSSATRFLPMDRTPALVAFSESAHRVYCFDQGGRVTAYDRFSLEPVETLTLPTPALDVRTDPKGRFALVRPAEGDSVWVLDLIHWSVNGAVRGRWTERLPLVAPDGTVLIDDDGDLATVSYRDRQVVARLPGGDERWLPMAWDPRRPALELASDRPAQTAPLQQTQEFYVQVSSTSNREWAEDLAANLRRAGIDASVLAPGAFDTRYRVVLGPYASREEADADRRTLNMPSWIITRDTTHTAP